MTVPLGPAVQLPVETQVGGEGKYSCKKDISFTAFLSFHVLRMASCTAWFLQTRLNHR